MKIAVFASGFGSNFEALIEAQSNGSLPAGIALLVTDKPDCYAVERAKQHHIEIFAFKAKEYASKENYETVLVDLLKEKGIGLVVLAGYMRIVGDVLLTGYQGRILNIHPSLLPAFPGLHAIEKAYEYGVKVFGVTIHYVDQGVDTGRIIAQDCFKANGNESLEEIENRIHQLEHKLYPVVVRDIIEKLKKEI